MVEVKGHSPVAMVSVSQNFGIEWVQSTTNKTWVGMTRVSGKQFHSSNEILDLLQPNKGVFIKQW